MEITKERLKQLEAAEEKLQVLEAYGVDNWSGYDDAMSEIYHREEMYAELEDLTEAIFEEIYPHIDEPAGRGCGYGISGGQEEVIGLIMEWHKKKEKEK